MKKNKKIKTIDEKDSKLLNTVVISYSKVDVCESQDGDVHTDFKKDGSISTYINIKEELPIIIGDVIHELFETKLLKTGCRYHRTDMPENFEPISCLFVIDHDEFQIACHEVGLAVVRLLPEIIKRIPNQDKK